jgi:hypothetical protein
VRGTHSLSGNIERLAQQRNGKYLCLAEVDDRVHSINVGFILSVIRRYLRNFRNGLNTVVNIQFFKDIL